ncbi:major facilitator superfamily domain-containing protein 6-like protein B [Lingula anatina]|uniref:Major facilitator superfamily domain-containing protein 6-like protein B n=1 Tax=Lingula anatina TaxID=7574 RepID=A0A1S3JYZ2_LINAN|nr:major facilitator superfamily domain-containing protein 6-like protein B [Lingula anatina]|eukprot:XP_013415608.1 major facilitator superfamily domain-containing protein 6-like protein B [Lingula anatina]
MGKSSKKKSSMAKKGNTKQKRLVNAFEVVNITKSLVITDFFHFFYAGGKVCLLPFLTLFFRQLGLSATQAGIICAAKALVGLVSTPLWSACSTKCNVRRVTLMSSIFVMIAIYLALTLVPPVNQPGKESLMFCSQNQANQNSGHNPQTSNKTVVHVTLPKMPSTVTTVFISTTATTLSDKEMATNSSQSKQKEGSTPPSPSVSPSSSASPAAETTAAAGKTTTGSENNEASGSGSDNTKTVSSAHSNLAETTPWFSSTGFVSSTFSVSQGLLSTTSPASDIEVGERKPDVHLSKAQIKMLIRQLGLTREDLISMTNKELKVLLTERLKELTALKKAGNKHGEWNSNLEEGESFGRNPYDQFERNSFQGRINRHTVHKRYANETKGLLDKLKDLKEKLSASEYYSKYKTFLVIMFVLLLGEFFAAPTEKIADDAWYDFLENVDDVEKYGQQGFWALLATDIFAVVIALIVDNTDCVLSLNINHFMIHFYMFAGLMTLSLLVGFCYPLTGKCKSKPRRGAVMKTVRLLCCDLRCFTFAVSTLVMGIIRGSLFSFLFWQIEDLGGTEIVMGLTITVAACAEIPMFFMGGWLARKISSTVLVGTALVAQAGQLVYFSFLWSPWAAVPIHVLNMFTSTGFWKAMETHQDFSTSHHAGIGRTVKTFLNAIYNCLGFAIGCGLSGWLYDQFGIAILFRGAAVLCGAWFLLFLLLQKCVPKKERVEYIKLLNADDDTFSDSSDNLYEDDWLKNAMKEA